MGAGVSAVERSGGKIPKRSGGVTGAVSFSLGVGAAATLSAALASLLVDNVMAKRILWVLVAVAVAVGVGLWRAACATMTPPDSGLLPQGSRSGSPE